MRQQLGAAIFAVVAAGSAPMASAVQAAEAARLTCMNYRPLGRNPGVIFEISDQSITTTDGCRPNFARPHIEADSEAGTAGGVHLSVYRALPEVHVAGLALRINDVELRARKARELHATAEALYKATSSDAQTFAAALLLPDVRRKVEAVLGKKLSNDECRVLAKRAQAEAVYWYEYMQGLEHPQAGAITSR